MNILITGAKGFMGKNLTEALKNIRDGKDRTHPEVYIGKIFLYDQESTQEELEAWCGEADMVFHLAGVNRPKDQREFMEGNFGFSSVLLDTLKKCGNTCPVMLASSVQATLLGRYAQGEYGKSKRAGEELFFSYAEETGTKVLAYRFPNVFGKWCRPNYNSVVATFCYNLSRDLPIVVNDPSVELDMVYIDDLVEEMVSTLQGRPHRCDFEGLKAVPSDLGRYCFVPVSHTVTLGKIVELLQTFRDLPENLMMPEIPKGSFSSKLYSTWVSYLPKEKVSFPLTMHKDARGSFTELLKTRSCGQFSVNISKPGITKGLHWHQSKWEFFMVVSGHGLVRERRIGSDEVLEFEVSGEKIEAVHMLPGYTHAIINLSETDDLVTVMWANETFDPSKPDTFYEEI